MYSGFYNPNCKNDTENTITQQKAVEEYANYSDDSRLPNKHEASSLFYNMNLIGNIRATAYWTNSAISNSLAWSQNFNGVRAKDLRSLSLSVRCIRK